MRRLPIAAAALASTLLVALSAPALARLEPSPAAFLAAKVAGPPVDCLAGFQRDRETRTYASGDILYRGSGTTWYLNHPAGGPRFTSRMAFVSRTPTDQLCRGDTLQVVDPVSGTFLGVAILGAFTPYADAPKR